MKAAADSARPPLRVGLTGGVASGKSTVSALFAGLGVPVIDADLIAREVVAPGTALRARLFELFGEAIRGPDGGLDRAALRRLVFAQETRRRELEALLHPAIRERAEQLAAEAMGPYQLHVNPLMVETREAARYDRVLVVDCPESLQYERLRARDGCSPVEARAMLEAQVSRAARLAIADDLIRNDAGLPELQPRVEALHQHYLQLAAAAPTGPAL
jgi:dephospho-CoA kinase